VDEVERAAKQEKIITLAKKHQKTEQVTAINRARTGRQYAEMNSGMNAELYPNIRWLPSRSATPREEHRHYWGLVLPKDDAFWKTNQPGNLWNCKCDWEETLAKPTRKPSEEAWTKPDKGLDGNPGDGTVFGETSSYYKVSEERRGSAKVFYYKTARSILRVDHLDKDNITVEKNMFKKSFKDSRYGYKQLVNHAYTEEEFAVTASVPREKGKLKFITTEELGAVKDMQNEADIKNVKNKKNRGVKGYCVYSFEFLGKVYIIKTENIKDRYEQFYSIAPKEKTDYK